MDGTKKEIHPLYFGLGFFFPVFLDILENVLSQVCFRDTVSSPVRQSYWDFYCSYTNLVKNSIFIKAFSYLNL